MKRDVVVNPATLDFRCEFSVAGAVCRMATNSQILCEILQSAHEKSVGGPLNCFDMQIVVSACDVTGSHSPHFRGLAHLVTASFNENDFLVFDLLRRKVTGTVSERTAADSLF